MAVEPPLGGMVGGCARAPRVRDKCSRCVFGRRKEDCRSRGFGLRWGSRLKS